MKKQGFNPYMPSYEYVPDGEPHAFGDRIYVYGSHDRFGGGDFCLNDYICYSAPKEDLSQWRYEGVIYRKEQDIRNQNIPEDATYFEPSIPGVVITNPEEQLNPPGVHAMWAPDVVYGPDGRYYLYYCLDFLPQIGVAVADTPAGPFAFLGLVRHEDGTPLGDRDGDLIQFDPGIFIDEDGSIYLYSGNAPAQVGYGSGPQGSTVMTLKEDMLTIKTEPKALMPDVRNSQGTGFEGHEFFEASSIRKINGRYYFVYSSVKGHELCYAVSDRPDEGYTYGGVVVDNADIFEGDPNRQEGVMAQGNNHGGIEEANGQWYVFYHRQTDRGSFSRQACAEKIFFDSQGRIRQAEITSCGLNDGPLAGEGVYPANICCHLSQGGKTTFSHPMAMGENFPYLTQDEKDITPEDVGFPESARRDAAFPVQFVRNFKDQSIMGFKYFDCRGLKRAGLTLRGKAEGTIVVSTVPLTAENSDPAAVIGEISVDVNTEQWTTVSGEVNLADGVWALYFTGKGLTGPLDIAQIELG